MSIKSLLRGIKKKAAVAIAACMVIGAAFDMFFPALVQADAFNKTTTNTRLGTSGIKKPASGAGGWSYVYYGKKQNVGGVDYDVKYRVLNPVETGYGGSTLFLDCNNTLINKDFSGVSSLSSGANVWSSNSCNLRNYLNTGNDSFYNTGFNDSEKLAIIPSYRGSTFGPQTYYEDTDNNQRYDYTALSGEHIFVLDSKEATYEDYGYPQTSNVTDPNPRSKSGINGSLSDPSAIWWLRSPVSNTYERREAIVDDDGTFLYDNAYDVNTLCGVSPAFNVNLSSIIFSSVIDNNKKYGDPEASYKLTIKDNAMAINIKAGSQITWSGDNLSVPYTVTNGTNVPNQVSYLITTKKYNETGATIKAYGKLSNTYAATGTGTIPMTNYNSATDHIYIMAEKVNGQCETDYANEPKEITVPSKPKPEPSRSVSYDDDDDDDPPVSRYILKGVGLRLDTVGDMVVTIATNDGNDDSYEHFTGMIQLNGEQQRKNKDFYASKGSTVITVKKAAIDKLGKGTQYLAVFFDDGDIIIPFDYAKLTKTVTAPATPASSAASALTGVKLAPKTGEV